MLLKFFRKRKNMKRIMWALAILIIPAFVIWGAGTSAKNKGGRPDYAGKIFGKKVSYEDYYNMWNVARDHAIRSFGNNVPQEFIDQMAWSRIILIEEAKRQNLAVSDREVVETLASFQAFQRRGAFDKKLYKSMLGDKARAFEEKLRDDLLISRLKDKTTSSIKFSDEDVKNEYKKRFEKIKSAYALIPFTDSEKDVRYNDSDLENFYQQNKQAFKKGEQVNVKYLDIPYSRFDNEVTVKDEQIQRFFEEHITDFKKPGTEETPVLDDNIKNSIRQKLALDRKISLAEEIGYKALDQVAQKKNLEEPARDNSLEMKETGFFSANDEIPGIGWAYEFAKTSFELEKNQINNMLIKTDKALYIIQLKDKLAAYVPDYAEVKDSVKKAFIKEGAIKLSHKISEKVYLDISNRIKNSEKFEDAVKKHGLEVKETDFIGRDGYIPEIGPAVNFVETCLTLKQDEASRPIKMQDSWVIAALAGYEGMDENKFFEEKKIFGEKLLEAKKETEFNKWFENLKKEADFVSYTGN